MSTSAIADVDRNRVTPASQWDTIQYGPLVVKVTFAGRAGRKITLTLEQSARGACEMLRRASKLDSEG